MRRILTFLLLSSLAFAQLATQEATPIPIQSRRSAAASLAFNSNVVSGHELIVSYECFSGGNCATGPSIADTLTTTWTSRVTQGSTQCGNLWVWTGQASSSGADTITITNGGSFQGLVISEWANVSNTLDVASTATGWTSTTTITTPSVTTTRSSDLLYLAAHTCNSGQIAATYPVMPIGDDTTADSYGAGWKIASSIGSNNGAFKYASGGGSSGNSAIIAMKASTSLAVVTTKIPDASTSEAYSFDLHAQGGTTSCCTWARTAGATLPCGLSLSSGGTISGTPTCGNGDASMTFQATDGASNTATASLTLHVGTSFNTVSLVQTQAPTCGGSLGTVTADNLILLTVSNTGGGIPKFTDSVGTVYAYLPLSFELYSSTSGTGITNLLIWGFAGGSGADTLSCTAGAGLHVANIITHEFSNVQKTFDPSVLVATLNNTASPYTSGSMTTPVTELLFSWVMPFTSSTTITTQAPYTAGKSNTGGSEQLTAEYQITATAGSKTASYAATSNTDGNWGIALTAFRPTSSGTAALPSSNRGSSQVY